MDITYDDFDDLMKFFEMLLQMDCCVRVLYEEVLEEKMVYLRIWKKNWNGLMNLLASRPLCPFECKV